MIQSVEKVYYRKKLHKIKVYVNSERISLCSKGGGCPEGKALGRSPQRAKYPKLTAPSIAAIVKYP